jgi:hypothetical protein
VKVIFIPNYRVKLCCLFALSSLGLLLAASILGCTNPSGGGGGGGGGPSIQSIEWQNDGAGFIQFSTNDTNKYGYGYYIPYVDELQSTMTTVTAKAKKMSGAPAYGWGIVFCYQDTNNFYRLLISGYGHYQVAKKVAGTYYDITPWTTWASNINTSAGVTNVISVTLVTPGNFSVSFNGGVPENFAAPEWTGGAAGFYTMIGTSTYENFPATPSDVRFKFTSPVLYP